MKSICLTFNKTTYSFKLKEFKILKCAFQGQNSCLNKINSILYVTVNYQLIFLKHLLVIIQNRNTNLKFKSIPNSEILVSFDFILN